MVSIHGPLGYEPNTLTTAPLRWVSCQFHQLGKCSSSIPVLAWLSESGFVLRQEFHARGRADGDSVVRNVTQGGPG